MSINQCTSCNGMYATVQADGSRYFHVCPPGVVPADVRNENTLSSAAQDAKTIKSAGKGIKTVSSVPPEFTALSTL